jgi:polyadenylate-binding protein
MVAGKPLYVALAQRKDVRRSQLQQQIQAKSQLRMQQQAAVAGGIPGQYLPGPIFYGPGQQPGFMPTVPGGARGGMPFPGGNPQMMMQPPRNGQVMPPPQGQWGPGGGAPRTGPNGQPIMPGYGMPPVYNGYPGPQGQPQRGGHQGGRGGFNNFPRNGPRRYNNNQAPVPPQGSLAAVVASAPEEAQKQIIGEALYPKIIAQEGVQDPEIAGKITGMLLDMDNSELLVLAENDGALKTRVEEALTAYNRFLEQQQSATEGEVPPPAVEATEA